MRAASTSPFSPVEAKFPMADQPAGMRAVRILIWVYLVLLVVEGAVRKWIFPQLSDPLLIIRDPVLLGIYFYALRAHIFPGNAYVVLLGVIGVFSMVLTI